MLPQEQLPPKERGPRLIVDAMLGRLARWLRLMGYDTLYWRTGSDTELASAARRDGRLIITRDLQLAGRRGVHSLLIKSDTLDEQIGEIRAAFGPDPQPFSRCPECNAELADLPHDKAQGLVPAYVWHTQSAFKCCAVCHRIYWKGTHWPGMQTRLEGE